MRDEDDEDDEIASARRLPRLTKAQLALVSALTLFLISLPRCPWHQITFACLPCQGLRITMFNLHAHCPQEG